MTVALVTSSPLCSQRARQLAIVALLGVTCTATNSWADPVRLISVLADIQGAAQNHERPELIQAFRHESTDFGPSNLTRTLVADSLGTAESTLSWAASSMRIGGSLSATSTTSGGIVTGQAWLDTRFLVLEPVAFTFSGLHSGFGARLEFVGFGRSGVYDIFLDSFPRTEGITPPVAFFHSGVLDPGDYLFYSHVVTGAGSSIFLDYPRSSSSLLNVDLSFTPLDPVPEPTSMLLLGTGLLGVVLRRTALPR